jgi:tetratricopeptide (TPR) repeat protein
MSLGSDRASATHPTRITAGGASGPWWFGAAVIAVGAFAAYANSFHGPFVFDDLASIRDNPTIRHLSAMGQVLSPPATEGSSVTGRPVVNLSLAVNYAWGGLAVEGYHAFNLAIHLLSGLTLFGIVRRTLAHIRESAVGAPAGPRGLRQAPGTADEGTDQTPTWLALAVALLWTVHPLQTESVTFVVQRTESLMGLFYLLTLYFFIRYAEGRAANVWAGLSVLACLLGMATKEVMVSAPLLVLLFDRTFVSGSFREAWRRHARYYPVLAATWLMLAFLVVQTGGRRGAAAGFGLGVDGWTYALTQCRAIMMYLKLAVWPHPLVVDYGTAVATRPGEVAPQAFALLLMLAATAIALWRRPALGFLGAWFFVILAPSSSVVPLVTQTMAEHRMYLPLAAVIALVVTGAHRLAGRTVTLPLLALAAGAVWLTFQRNEVYRSEESLWRDTVNKRPDNSRALSSLGNVLRDGGRTTDAIALYQAALRLNPSYPEAHNNLGIAWSYTPGRLNDAIAEFQAALRVRPNYAEAHNNLGNAWMNVPGRSNDGIAQFQEALRLYPDYAEAHNNLGNAWMNVPGRLNEAVAQFQEALRLRPDYAEAHYNLGMAWSNTPGRLNETIAEFQAAVRLKPGFAEAHNNLGNAWMGVPGRLDAAVAQFQEAVRLRPDYAEAHYNLASALMNLPGRSDDAIAQFREVLRLKPGFAEAHYGLAVALLGVGDRGEEANAHLEAFLQLWPDKEQARQLVARIKAQLKK